MVKASRSAYSHASRSTDDFAKELALHQDQEKDFIVTGLCQDLQFCGADDIEQFVSLQLVIALSRGNREGMKSGILQGYIGFYLFRSQGGMQDR